MDSRFKIDPGSYPDIVTKYIIEKLSLSAISKFYNVGSGCIKYILIKQGVEIKDNSNCKHHKKFTEIDKENIINLYVNEKRGKSFIAGLYNTSDNNISYWLKKWGIPTWSRKEISKRIREVYGPTKGFTGREHTKESKSKISSTEKLHWEINPRELKNKYSSTYLTLIGKVLGRYEVAYLQNLFEKNQSLPKLPGVRYKTPYGTYMPDFEFEDRFVEIKSKYTLEVSKGLRPTTKGNYTDNQWKKICWLNDNYKKVEVIVLDSNEVYRLFTRAKRDGVLLVE